MGSYVFKWPHAADTVYVTGTFDDWGKTVQLEKSGDVFLKDVQLPKIEDKIYYKFVVDGTWTTDSEQAQEKDSSGNMNNVLKPDDLKKSGATQAAPGAFPETPANEAQEFSVKPIPASGGIGNPVQTQPGEKLLSPQGDVNANVTTSKEDYEKAGSASVPVVAAATSVAGGNSASKDDSLPEKSANMIPESSLPVRQADPFIQSAGADTTTAKLAGEVPLENSNKTVQSAGAGTTTAALAGQQPLEPKREAKVLDEGTGSAGEVPEVVKESIAESKQGPEAAANPEAVEEKKEVEAELLKEVKPSNETGVPAPTTSAANTESAPAPTSDKPTVTTGVDSAQTPTKSTATSSTPATPSSDAAKEDKKKKRKSFFGKLKDKLK